MLRLSAALADRYAIERELGAGGMATVYLARDLKHDRDVALKVLRPELGAVLGPDRFLAEIKITARLDHPHILTLIDSGASDGYLFYVLPYVRGESLRDRLNREKQLGMDEALLITRQVASALDYAHRQGVVHRDIKPENILLQEGEAMLADFGIALAVKEAGGNRLTETGLSLGTPQYMSPEQATGDRTLDARSDVYSLAAVLYEMLAGEPPVTGPTAQAMIAKLMTERPTRLRVVRDTVPEGIENAVAKALAKTPADRFPSAAEFAAALAKGGGSGDVGTERWQPRTARWMVGAGVVVTAGIVWLVAGQGGRGPAQAPFLAAVPAQLTTSGRAHNGVPSPDGTQLAYTEEHCEEVGACRGNLVIRETAGEGVSTIVSQPGHWARPGAWSPDGRWVLFHDFDVRSGTVVGLYIVSQRGGTPRRVAAGSYSRGSFVAPDTLVVTPFEGPRHWLRRIVASSGTIVDSVLLPASRFVGGVTASPDGARLLVQHFDQLGEDSATLSVVGRDGRTTDSLRVSSADAVWAGSGAVVLGFSIRSGFALNNGQVVVRRKLDTRGRFAPAADTLRTIADGAVHLLGADSSGNQLFYELTRLGEVRLWTATRADARGAFTRGRLIGSSTRGLSAFISPRGSWVLIQALTATGSSRQARLAVEPFAGGESHMVEPAIANYLDFAFAPSDDSLVLATMRESGGLVFTAYPLPAGAPVPLGSFARAFINDLEWVADGRLAAAVDSGRVVRVFGRNGEVRDFRIPDSLGVAVGAGRSPERPELVLSSELPRGDRFEFLVSRLNLLDGRFAVAARTSTIGPAGAGTWWTTDGWVHVQATGPGDATQRLYRARIQGGAFEAEPAIGFVSNGMVWSLSHDGRRAVVREQSTSADLWVLRSAAP